MSLARHAVLAHVTKMASLSLSPRRALLIFELSKCVIIYCVSFGLFWTRSQGMDWEKNIGPSTLSFVPIHTRTHTHTQRHPHTHPHTHTGAHAGTHSFTLSSPLIFKSAPTDSSLCNGRPNCGVRYLVFKVRKEHGEYVKSPDKVFFDKDPPPAPLPPPSRRGSSECRQTTRIGARSCQVKR